MLAVKRQEQKDKWESGNILELAKDEQMLRLAAASGECQGFRYVQELELDTLNGELEDG